LPVVEGVASALQLVAREAALEILLVARGVASALLLVARRVALVEAILPLPDFHSTTMSSDGDDATSSVLLFFLDVSLADVSLADVSFQPVI